MKPVSVQMVEAFRSKLAIKVEFLTIREVV